MNLGCLATIGGERPPNLVVVVLDNQEYGTTGGQPTPTAFGTDLASVARSCGIERSTTARSAVELAEAVTRSAGEPGPWVIVAKVAESRPSAKPPLDCVFIKQRFMASIGAAEAATWGGPV